MFLRDFAVYGMGEHAAEIQKRIIVENSFLDDVFLEIIGKKYKTKKAAKIGLRLCVKDVFELNGFKLAKNKAVELLNIVEYWVDFDFEYYETLDRLSQKKYYWKMICDSVLEIAKQLNWDTIPMQNIYEEGLKTKW